MRSYILQVLFLCFLGCADFFAQNDVTVAGGDAFGSGGSSSYSLGQVAYTGGESQFGSINQGVQQPYEYYITDVTEAQSDFFKIAIFPNPTEAFVQIDIENLPLVPLTMELLSIEGKRISQQLILSKTTQVNMQGLAPANYFLKIFNTTMPFKVFKIVKCNGL
jgi:hypothetical protein